MQEKRTSPTKIGSRILTESFRLSHAVTPLGTMAMDYVEQHGGIAGVVENMIHSEVHSHEDIRDLLANATSSALSEVYLYEQKSSHENKVIRAKRFLGSLVTVFDSPECAFLKEVPEDKNVPYAFRYPMLSEMITDVGHDKWSQGDQFSLYKAILEGVKSTGVSEEQFDDIATSLLVDILMMNRKKNPMRDDFWLSTILPTSRVPSDEIKQKAVWEYLAQVIRRHTVGDPGFLRVFMYAKNRPESEKLPLLLGLRYTNSGSLSELYEAAFLELLSVSESQYTTTIEEFVASDDHIKRLTVAAFLSRDSGPHLLSIDVFDQLLGDSSEEVVKFALSGLAKWESAAGARHDIRQATLERIGPLSASDNPMREYILMMLPMHLSVDTALTMISYGLNQADEQVRTWADSGFQNAVAQWLFDGTLSKKNRQKVFMVYKKHKHRIKPNTREIILGSLKEKYVDLG